MVAPGIPHPGGNAGVGLSAIGSGRGIAANSLPYVFDRFRQQEAGASRKHGGLGLGLAIVRNLVELRGGSVSAHSDGEGLGAAFIVRLPARVPASEG